MSDVTMTHKQFNRLKANIVAATYCRAAIVAYEHFRMPDEVPGDMSELGKMCEGRSRAIGDRIAASIVADPAVIRAAAEVGDA